MLPLWEVLVPTVRPNTDGKKFFTTRFHRVWDTKVREITGGLTVLPPTKGTWVSPGGSIFRERMIPVRIMCTEADIWKVVKMTADYYEQEAVMFHQAAVRAEVFQHPTRRNTS